MSSPHSTAGVRAVRFDASAFEEHATPTLIETDAHVPAAGVLWLDVDVDATPEALALLGEAFDLHPLAVADALGPAQRAKYESYPTFDFLVGRMAPREHGHSLAPHQLCLFVAERWVISAHRGGGDLFAAVRDRLRAGGPIRQQGAGFLACALLTAVVDEYFPAIEEVGDRLESLEAAILGPMDRRVIRRIQRTRHDLMILRRTIWPMREVMSQVARAGEGRFDERTRPYLRDVYDQTVQAIDLVEGYRDLSSGLVDLYLSTVSFRTNEVMRC